MPFLKVTTGGDDISNLVDSVLTGVRAYDIYRECGFDMKYEK
jgi:hypothetical protein